jgi:ABC-type branched-subunit amino acid transport system ATPase component
MSQELALHADNLTMQFGGLKAVSELTLEIPVGAIFGLIGPNGAGKTTAFNMLTGVYKPTIGRVKIFGNDTVNLKPYQITRFGIGRTFQNPYRRTRRLSATAPRSCSRFSSSILASRTRRRTCRTATSAGLRSLARWRRELGCCFSTSLPLA